MIRQICFLALALFEVGNGQQPTPFHGKGIIEPDPVDLNPKYDYAYSVHDEITGDQKNHAESREGNTVHGEYSLVEPDGTLRTVKYIANEDGFNAVVTLKTGFTQPIPFVTRKVNPQPLNYGFSTSSDTSPIYKSNSQLLPFLFQNRQGTTEENYKALTSGGSPGKSFFNQPQHNPRFLDQRPGNGNRIPLPSTPSSPPPNYLIQKELQKYPIEIQKLPPLTPSEVPQEESTEGRPPKPTERPLPIGFLPQRPDHHPQQPQGGHPPSSPSPASRPSLEGLPGQQSQEQQGDDDGEAIVIEATGRRGHDEIQNNENVGSSFTYSSKRGSLYDFTVAY